MSFPDLNSDVVALAQALVDVQSVSHHEAELAGLVEQELRRHPHLETTRYGNTVVSRTLQQRPRRVVVAGHLDTVPLNDNLPSRVDDQFLHGLGSCDMKGGVAVALSLAAALTAPPVDVTYVFYDGEEVEQEFNGLAALARDFPEVLAADFAILMEPSNGAIEAGCQGSVTAEVKVTGRRAHSARAWVGHNAIHAAAPVLNRLNDYVPRLPTIDGLAFHEGLSAVGVRGGVAMNVVPDECVVTVNHRFAPDRSVAEATSFLLEFFDGFEVSVLDASSGAHPSLSAPPVASFRSACGGVVAAKLGWTDVARFVSLGVPALNFGPGDPLLAHAQDERVPLEQIRYCRQVLGDWLSGLSPTEAW